MGDGSCSSPHLTITNAPKLKLTVRGGRAEWMTFGSTVSSECLCNDWAKWWCYIKTTVHARTSSPQSICSLTLFPLDTISFYSHTSELSQWHFLIQLFPAGLQWNLIGHLIESRSEVCILITEAAVRILRLLLPSSCCLVGFLGWCLK